MGFGRKAAARVLKCSVNTVKRYWDAPIGAVFKAPPPAWVGGLDWKEIESEVAKGTSVYVLWEELCKNQKISVQYPGFWKQVNKRCPQLTKTMHRVFAPGSRCEIDYGTGIDIIDLSTGEVVSTNLFVGVLCYSRYVFAEFTLTQSSPDFLSSHVKMFEWFGGVPQIVTPDNLKSAVSRTHRYDPEINPAYTRLATHYGCAVVPARPRRPQDKAIVERTIQIFKRWFYHRVRNRTFTSLVELNQCLREHLELFHARKHRILQKTRKEMFETERGSLTSLPAEAFRVMSHCKARLHPDCHLSFDGNHYSGPFELRGKELDVWAGNSSIEIYFDGKRVAFHGRSKTRGKFITDKNHYPPEHQAYLEATPTWVREQASLVGPETGKLVTGLLSGPYPLKYLRSAQGIVRLAKTYGRERLEAACKKANELHQNRYRFIENLIKLSVNLSTTKQNIQRGDNPLLRGEELYH